MQTHLKIEKMSDGLRMLFRILLTARADCLPTSCPCSSARARAREHLVLMLESSCSSAVELVLVLECSFFGVLARVLVLPMEEDPSLAKPFILRLFAFCSVCRCKIVRQSQFFSRLQALLLCSSTPSLAGLQQQQQLFDIACPTEQPSNKLRLHTLCHGVTDTGIVSWYHLRAVLRLRTSKHDTGRFR